MLLDRPTFFVAMLSKIVSLCKKLLTVVTRKNLSTYADRMIALQKQCRKDFKEFVDTINSMPIYFLSQY